MPLLVMIASLPAFGPLSPLARAETVAYWRFESDAFLADSGGNAAGPFNLTNEGANDANDAYALFATGPGAHFPQTIPLTGAANQGGAWFTGAETPPDSFTAPFNAAFNTLSFTIEAFLNMPANGGGPIFYTDKGIYDMIPLGFHVSTKSGMYFEWTGYAGGGSLTSSSTSSTIERPVADKDYYVAVSFQYTGSKALLTFYQKNLTDNGPLLSQVKTLNIYYIINNLKPLWIGKSPYGEKYDGLLDEMRFSNRALTSSELLVYTTPFQMLVPVIALDGTATIKWTSRSNHVYTLYHSTDLTNGFSVLQSNISGTPPMNTYIDIVNGAKRKFWRVSTQD